MIHDGYLGALGVDESQDLMLPRRDHWLRAVNRTFRAGKNQTRPPIRDIELSFDSPNTEEAFRLGAITGAFGYTGWRGLSKSCLVVACHDRLVRILITGRIGYASSIKVGLTPGYMLSWFAQAQDRIYWQNDVDNPVGWDGLGPTYSLSGVDKMPRGSAMAYANGRLAVAVNGGANVILSDYVYGNGLTDTRGVESFIEYQQTNDLGAIGSYAELGKIVAIAALPAPDTVNGEGSFIMLCENGAWTFDSSGLRADWLSEERQRKTFGGNGCPSPFGFSIINQDLWFLSTEGYLTSWKRYLSELGSASAFLPASNEVRSHIESIPENLRQFVSMTNFDRRLLTTCHLTHSQSSLGGVHRFGQAIAALDFDHRSITSETYGFAWDGLWTGPNPIQLVSMMNNGARACFILSHDDDGKNRLFELGTRSGHDEVERKTRLILSQLETGHLFTAGVINQPIQVKTLSGASIIYSGAGDASIAADYRPAFHGKYYELDKSAKVSCEHGGEFELPFYMEDSGIDATRSPSGSDCKEDTSTLPSTSEAFQIRLRIEGIVTINRLAAKASDPKDDTTPACNKACKKAIAGDSLELNYKIVENGNS